MHIIAVGSIHQGHEVFGQETIEGPTVRLYDGFMFDFIRLQ